MSENSIDYKTKQKLKPEKAFLHVFLKDGLDENKLLEAKENVEALIQEYQDLEKNSDSTNLRENENDDDWLNEWIKYVKSTFWDLKDRKQPKKSWKILHFSHFSLSSKHGL